VPAPGNPQSLNRYAYTLNNPLRYTDPSGHYSINAQATTYLNSLNKAQDFLDMIQAYLYLHEYEYTTDLEFLLGIAINDGGPEALEALANNVLGLAPGVVGWMATLYANGVDTANQEAIKTLRRLRDDITNAIDLWQQSDLDITNIQINVFDATFLNADSYAVRLNYQAQLTSEEQRMRWLRGETEQRTLLSRNEIAGGPLNGSLNNFGKIAINLMIDYGPMAGGVLYMKGKNIQLVWFTNEESVKIMKRAILVLMLGIILTGCYKHAQSRVGGDGFVNYQHDQPRDYCRSTIATASFDLYCPDGLLTVEFVSSNQSLTDIIESKTLFENSEVDYVIQDFTGKTSIVLIAELQDITTELIDVYPMFIAVGQFNTDLVMVAEGRLYNTQFEQNFRTIFRRVVLTLESTDN